MASYLMDPNAAALTIGSRCGTSVSTENDGLLAILEQMLPRIEDAMDVSSLTFGETTDTFSFEAPFISTDARRPKLARLSNGYVVNSVEFPITITDPNGDVLASTDFTAELRYGVVSIPVWLVGTYTITYSAGFTATVADNEATPSVPSIFEDVPVWIEGVLVTLLTTWYRTVVLAPKIPDNFRYGEIMRSLYQELNVRIYKRYMRPRAECIFPVNSVRADGMRV